MYMPLSFLHHLFHAFTDMLVKDRFIQSVRPGTTKASTKLEIETSERRWKWSPNFWLSFMSLIGASKPMSLQGIPWFWKVGRAFFFGKPMTQDHGYMSQHHQAQAIIHQQHPRVAALKVVIMLRLCLGCVVGKPLRTQDHYLRNNLGTVHEERLFVFFCICHVYSKRV